MNEYRFSLEQAVKYSDKGEFLDADFIVFNHWTGKHSKHYFKYAQMVGGLLSNRSNFNADEPKEAVEQKELSDDELIEMLHMVILSNESMDAYAFVEVFKSMVCHKGEPLAVLNGEKPMQPEHFDELTPDDQLKAAAGYAVFFGVGLLKAMKNT